MVPVGNHSQEMPIHHVRISVYDAGCYQPVASAAGRHTDPYLNWYLCLTGDLQSLRVARLTAMCHSGAPASNAADKEGNRPVMT